MQTTTNYNLKQYEGSDLFNPLNVDNPNMGIIDGAMHDNAIHGIGEAVETLAGTLHSIVRQNPDCPMFRFVATSDFTYGDSFTVDGISYTAQMPDGQQMQTNAFVTGSNVLCCLEGTELTFFVTSMGTAPDSDKLGGELPDYYAKQSDMTIAQGNITTLGTNITNVGNLIKGIIVVPATVTDITSCITYLINTLVAGDLSSLSNNSVKGVYWEGRLIGNIIASRPVSQLVFIQFNTTDSIYVAEYNITMGAYDYKKKVDLTSF